MITPSRGRSRCAAGKRGRCRCRRRLFPRSPVRRSNQPIRRFAVGQLGEVRDSLTGWPDQGEFVGRVEKPTLRHRANTPSRARASTGRRRDRATSPRHGSSQPSSATQKVRRRGASSSPSPPRARATRSRSAFGGGTSFPSRTAPAPRRRRARRPRDRSARVDALDAIPRVVRSDIDRLRRRSRRPPRRTRVARPARSDARNGPFRPSLVRPTSYSTRRPPAATDDEPTDASPTHPSKRRPASSSSASITRGRRPS